VAKGTGRSKTAVASPAFTNCSKRSPTYSSEPCILKEWAGGYNPDSFDELPIKYALGRIANRRNAAKASLAKKKRFGSAA
jgi:hypothetical protein